MTHTSKSTGTASVIGTGQIGVCSLAEQFYIGILETVGETKSIDMYTIINGIMGPRLQ